MVLAVAMSGVNMEGRLGLVDAGGGLIIRLISTIHAHGKYFRSNTFLLSRLSLMEGNH